MKRRSRRRVYFQKGMRRALNTTARATLTRSIVGGCRVIRRWAIIYRLEVQMHQSLQDWVGYIILSIYIFIIILEIIL